MIKATFSHLEDQARSMLTTEGVKNIFFRDRHWLPPPLTAETYFRGAKNLKIISLAFSCRYIYVALVCLNF